MGALNNQAKMTPAQKRESALIDKGHAEIMGICKQMNMRPTESMAIQFRLVLFGVVRMIGEPQITAQRENSLEDRIAALEAQADPWAGKYARQGPVVPKGQKPSDEDFKP